MVHGRTINACFWLSAAAWLMPGVAAAQSDEQELQEQIEEAETEFEELPDAVELEDWAEDELLEAQALRGLRRQRLEAARRVAYRALLPRLSIALSVGWQRSAGAQRSETATPASSGSWPGPDDADAAARTHVQWTVTLRLVWRLSCSSKGGAPCALAACSWS